MKVEGAHTLAAPRERAFQLITDPGTLAKTLPGCEKLEQVGANTFKVRMKLGLAALSGEYQGTVKLSEQRPPEHLRLTLDSRGPWGFASGDGTLTLETQGDETLIRYVGELKVGGVIASVGQRLLDGVSKMVIGQFFKNLAQQAVEAQP